VFKNPGFRKVFRAIDTVSKVQQLQPRHTPVVWGNRPGPLDENELRQFSEAGFLLLPKLQMKLDRELFNDCVAGCRELRDSPTEGVVRESSTEHVRTVFNAHGRLECFKRFASQEFLVSAAKQILDSDIYIHQTHINYKAAFFGEHYFWHQDYAFWMNEDGMPSIRALGVGLFVTEMSAVNGPLIVIPGSHRWVVPKQMRSLGNFSNTAGVKNSDETLSAHGLLTPSELAMMCEHSQPEAILGPEASVLLFDPNIAHASPDNLGPTERILALLFYNSTNNTLKNPSRPEYIASRDYQPL